MRALGPSMLGIGFRRALEVLTRGTPWMTRGSFMRAGSSFAGAVRPVSVNGVYQVANGNLFPFDLGQQTYFS